MKWRIAGAAALAVVLLGLAFGEGLVIGVTATEARRPPQKVVYVDRLVPAPCPANFRVGCPYCRNVFTVRPNGTGDAIGERPAAESK